MSEISEVTINKCFKKLEKIANKDKLSIQYKWVKSICENLAPRNGFAKYYLCVLEKKLTGNISKYNLNQLDNILITEPYWLNRFAEFNILRSSLT
jgi:hypothetical protein